MDIKDLQYGRECSEMTILLEETGQNSFTNFLLTFTEELIAELSQMIWLNKARIPITN